MFDTRHGRRVGESALVLVGSSRELLPVNALDGSVFRFVQLSDDP